MNNKKTKIPILEQITIIVVSLLALAVVQAASAQQTPLGAATMANDPTTLIKQGDALFNSGKYEEAIQYFDKALSIKPSYNYASEQKNKALSHLKTDVTQTSNLQQSPANQSQKIIPHENTDSFLANGKIESVIFTGSSQWNVTGDWNMMVEDGEVQNFTAKMNWFNKTTGHTHEFTKFESEGEAIELPPDNIVSIKGNMEVGTQGKVSWEKVPATINFGAGGKIITVSLGHEETNHHFAGQPITGIVNYLTPCSDIPGPSMEILPSCGGSDDGDSGDEEDEGED